MNSRLMSCQKKAIERFNAIRTGVKTKNWTIAFFEKYGNLKLAERQARSFAYALTHEPIYINDDEELVAQIYLHVDGGSWHDLVGVEGDKRWDDYSVYPTGKKAVAEKSPEDENFAPYFLDGVAPGHVSWDYGVILDRGALGLLEDVRAFEAGAVDEKAKEFYLCTGIVIQGMIDWVGGYVERLRELGQVEKANSCEAAFKSGAKTFRQAVQNFWFQYLAVMYENPHGGNGPGRLDWYLWPFLEADLAAGVITLEEAREVILELFIKLDERIHGSDGCVEAIVVGGKNVDGSSSVNPLSHIIIEAIMELKLTHPSVYVRLDSKAPKDFVELTVRYLLEGGNRAQVFGDDAVIDAMIKDGIAPEDAAHWGAGGCMEVGVQGMTGDMLWSFLHNVAITLEMTINGGKSIVSGKVVSPGCKELSDFANFEDLYAAFETELAHELGVLMKRIDIFLESYYTYRPSFLLSSMVHDCLERGRTINEGGARYADYGGTGLGIPNAGDSLYAIKRAVFDDKKYSGAEVLEAIRANFEGHEGMRKYLKGLPKYGSGNPEATDMTDRVLRSFTRILRSHTTPFGGHGRAVILGFIFSVLDGAKVGATADGRLSMKPLSQGLSPQSGSAVHGVTQAINDATSLSLDCVSGGASMMWDIDPCWAKPEFAGPILKTFIDKGGHIFQGNVTSVDELIAARDNAEGHENLMVRVGGFSARFCGLSRDLQDEIIERYRYSA